MAAFASRRMLDICLAAQQKLFLCEAFLVNLDVVPTHTGSIEQWLMSTAITIAGRITLQIINT